MWSGAGAGAAGPTGGPTFPGGTACEARNVPLRSRSVDALTRLWNTRVSFGRALSTGVSASIAAVVAHRITENWLAAIVAGVVWSALWLVVEVLLFHRDDQKRGESPDTTSRRW